jgi:hypothetical protein
LEAGIDDLTGLRAGTLPSVGRKIGAGNEKGGWQWQTDYPLAVDAAYLWTIEADTHQLGDDDWVRAYFYRAIRETYRGLGVEMCPKGLRPVP